MFIAAHHVNVTPFGRCDEQHAAAAPAMCYDGAGYVLNHRRERAVVAHQYKYFGHLGRLISGRVRRELKQVLARGSRGHGCGEAEPPD